MYASEARLPPPLLMCHPRPERLAGWGRAQEGQLGIGPGATEGAEMMESPRGGQCVLRPTLVGLCDGESSTTIQGVAAGGMHTLLLTMPHSASEDAALFSMGRGSDGQLGAGPAHLAPRLGVACQEA